MEKYKKLIEKQKEYVWYLKTKRHSSFMIDKWESEISALEKEIEQPLAANSYDEIERLNNLVKDELKEEGKGAEEYITDEQIKQIAPYVGKSCNEHWVNGFKCGYLHKPMPNDDVKSEAIKAANRSQFKSNHIYDHKSVEDGFIEGWQYASLLAKSVTDEDIENAAKEFQQDTTTSFNQGMYSGFIFGALALRNGQIPKK